ncbi:MAG TPA: CdaR family protein [Candidatus Krumholzibacteria bacterium]|nr:CdaR family protein [Candidatus Krumholzibacteria bacterium]
MKIARALTRNLGARLLALVVALLVWFNASGQEQVVRTRTAPLVLAGLPDSLAISTPLPTTADVRVVASRRQLVTVGFRRLSVVADVSGFGPGRHRITFGPDAVRGLGNVEPGKVQVVSPDHLDLEIEPMAIRRVQVSLATTGELPHDLLELDGGVSIEPPWVTVRGPASMLERVQHIATQPLDLTRVHDTVEREVALDVDRQLFTCNPSRVNVTLRVSPRGERVLANVPPTVLLDSESVDVEIVPNAVSLTLEGPSAVLDTLSSGDVSVLLSLGGRTPATYRMAPEVILPPGIRLTSSSADTLEVRVFPSGR